jgi:hypothetical protein
MTLTKCKECGEAVSNQAKTCMKCGAKVPRTSLVTKLVVGFIGLAVIGQVVGGLSGGTSSSTTSASKPKTQREMAQDGLKLKVDSWKAGALGSVMKLSFTATNSSTVAVKDLQIECKHSGKSGTTMDSNKRPVYEVVPAGGKLQKKDFNMGFINSQATNTSCEISDFALVE